MYLNGFLLALLAVAIGGFVNLVSDFLPRYHAGSGATPSDPPPANQDLEKANGVAPGRKLASFVGLEVGAPLLFLRDDLL